MEIFLGVIHLAIIGVLSFMLWKRNEQHAFFWPAWLFKMIAGISLGLLYQYYYSTGDTWTLFNDGVKVAEAVSQNPKALIRFFWNDDLSFVGQVLENNRPRALFLVKWIAVLNFIDGNNYWITSLYFSVISFFASWTFYKTLSKYFPSNKMEAAISILFVPSIVFWGSGIIKESLALASLFGLTSCFLRSYFNKAFQLLPFIIAMFCFWVLWNLKYYWAGVWLAVVVPLVIISFLKNKIAFVNRYPKSSWVFVLFFTAVCVSVIHPNFYLHRVLLVITDNHDAYINVSDPSDVIHFQNLRPSMYSVAMNSPWALFSGLFRPFIFESGNILQAAASVENFILFVLFLICLWKLPNYFPQWTELHLALAIYIILLSIFLALSTPNFGSLSRFKVGFTPFIWLAVLSGSGLCKRVLSVRPNKNIL
jgi:hypothetical protein